MTRRLLQLLYVVLALCMCSLTTTQVGCKQEEKPSADKDKDNDKKEKDKGDKEDDDEGSGKKKKKKGKKGDDDKESDDTDKKKGKGGVCPNTFKDLGAGSDDVSCTCEEDKVGGAVWGTDIYTEDSSPCAAAVHVGVIKSSGGKITMKAAKGCDAYTGSERNGIKSGGWGSFSGSFYFPDKGDGKCKKSEACPATFKEVKGRGEDTEITCQCADGGSGSVWGTEEYTQDSSICKAAVHAGVITSTGGSVSAKAAPGCKSYNGTTANGVTTSSWGEFDSSFYFPSKGDGVCAVAKVVTTSKWKTGDAVDVLWNGSWWQATIIAVATGEKYKVHYVGYASSWDEWVAGTRIRARTTSSLKGDSASAAPTGTSTAATGGYKVGDAVDVLWNGSWWQANVIAVGKDTWKVHYVGYDNSWDEWVGPTRIRARTAGSKAGSGGTAAPTATASTPPAKLGGGCIKVTSGACLQPCIDGATKCAQPNYMCSPQPVPGGGMQAVCIPAK